MTRINPYCPQCNGRGWYEAPYYGDMEPTMGPTPCEHCNPVRPIPSSGWVLIVAFFASIVGLLAWSTK